MLHYGTCAESSAHLRGHFRHPPDLSSLADLRPLTNQSYSFASQIYRHFSIQVTYLRFETTTCHLSRSPSYLSTLRRNPDEHTHCEQLRPYHSLSLSFTRHPFQLSRRCAIYDLEHQSFHYILPLYSFLAGRTRFPSLTSIVCHIR